MCQLCVVLISVKVRTHYSLFIARLIMIIRSKADVLYLNFFMDLISRKAKQNLLFNSK